MGENKEIKVRLSTIVYLFIIVVLVVALGVVYYLGFVKNDNANNMIANGEVAEKNNISVNQQVPETNNNIEENVEENKEVGKIDKNKELVYTEYSKYSSEYSISVPKININSQDVVDINNEIGKIIKDVKTEIQQETGLSGTIEYTSYINGDVLSVVILSCINSNYQWYDVYNVNTKTGKKCSNEELIALKGFTSSEFLDKLPKLYEKKFEEKCSSSKDEFDNSFYMERYNKTISKDNYGIEEPMFLDDNGDINIVAKIYQLAGGEAPYSEIIVVK